MALSSFQKAFKEARKNGETEFEFPPNSGKMFHTKYKEEVKTSAKPAAAMPAAPAKDTSNYSNEGRGSKPTSKLSADFTPDKPTSKLSADFTPGKVPSSEQAAANRQAVVDTAKSAFSGVGDYLNRTFTQQGREKTKKEARQSLGMKKGGSVSSRADGIAQRGKTRGKIC